MPQPESSASNVLSAIACYVVCADQTVMALLPGPSGRCAGVRLLNKAVEAIDEFYLRPNCPTLADLVREIGRR